MKSSIVLPTTVIDARQVHLHWQLQLEFKGGREDDALRLGAISGSLRRLAGNGLTGKASRFPHFAYLVPIGTRELLCQLAGFPVILDGALPSVLVDRADELQLPLREHFHSFPKLSSIDKCELLSALLNCALYPAIGAALESGLDLEMQDEWDFWLLYQVARYLQRTGEEANASDEYFCMVATDSPHWWQRCAAAGSLVARYARIAPSQTKLSEWAARTRSLLEEQPNEQFDEFDIGSLWASRSRRSLALAEIVGSRKQGASTELHNAEEAHARASDSIAAKDDVTIHLMRMNQRLILEANLKLGGTSESELDALASKVIAEDPGCADIHYAVGRRFERAGRAEDALRALTDCYQMGTPRSIGAASAMADIYEKTFHNGAKAAMWRDASAELLSQLELVV